MILYRAAQPEDGPALGAMAARCFMETFGHLYDQADADAFLAATFGPGGLPAQIADPAYTIRLAIEGETIVGFCKLGACTLPAPAPCDALELKQLYVLADWQGASVAAALMDWTIATARERGACAVALSVYVDNARARRFYARRGFVEIGKAAFAVGSQIDDDRIYCLAL